MIAERIEWAVHCIGAGTHKGKFGNVDPSGEEVDIVGDGNIYVRSRRAGERVMESLKRFITTKLKVNEQKSAVARPWERKFLD